MPSYTHSLDVDVPPSQVFAILQDVTRTPEWLERCTGIEVVTPGDPAVGQKLVYHYKDGRQTGTMEGEVTAYEPDRRIAMRYTDKMMDVTVDFIAEPRGEGASILTHAIDIATKGIGRVFGPLISRQLPKQTIDAITRLKALAEREASEPV